MNSGAEISPGQNGQTPRQIADALEAFLAEHPAAVLLEDGRPLFEMRSAKYTVGSEHGRCSLHLWNEERNLVRRVAAATPRKNALRLSTLRFGQTKPQMLELVAGPRSQDAFDTGSHAQQVSAAAGKGAPEGVSRLESGRISHLDGPRKKLWTGVCPAASW